MACLSSITFLDEREAERVSCMFCFCPMGEPVSLSCGHTFGRACLEDWVKIQSRCPLCRIHVDFSSVSRQMGMKRLMESFEVKCLNSENCEWTGFLKQLSGHIKNECPFETVTCEFKPCLFRCLRLKMPEHAENCIERPLKCEDCFSRFHKNEKALHEEKCPEKIRNCPLGCGEGLKFKDLDDHSKFQCPEQIIDCPLKLAGCEFKEKRKEMQGHLCGEKDSSFHLVLLAKFSSLSAEKNQLLIDQLSIQMDKISQTLASQQSVLNCAKEGKKSRSSLKQLKDINGLVSKSFDDFCMQFKDLNYKFSQNKDKFASLHENIFNELNNIKFSPSRKKSIPKPEKKEVQNSEKFLSPREIILDELNCGWAIQTCSPKKARHLQSGDFILLNDFLAPYTTYLFEIKRHSQGQLAIGACNKKALGNSWPNKHNFLNKFCYLFFCDGNLKIAGEENKFGKSNLRMSDKDKVEILLDPRGRKIFCVNRTKKLTAEIALAPSDDLQNFYPCVYMNSDGSSVKLLSHFKTTKGEILAFDRNFKGSEIRISPPNKAFYNPGSNFILANKPISLIKSVKLKILKQSSGLFSLGIGSMKVLRKNDFELKGKTGHGCYLFLANGFQQTEETLFLISSTENRCLIKTGHTVQILFDPSQNLLVLNNLTTSLTNHIDVSKITNFEDFYFCIRLTESNESVEIIS